MCNDFVEYLNSMNNASSNNLNALTESQILNKYYYKIQVERNVGKYIASEIKKNKNQCFILTGHAGDGKTAILVQVLRELNLFKMGESLQEKDTIVNEYLNLVYVKDMSELEKNKQIKYLDEILRAPQKEKSSILVSNTGPLLNAFKDLFQNDTDIENILLNQLDKNENEELNINGFEFKLINVARIDNVSFSKEILFKLIDDEIWLKCNNCENKEFCHIFSNYKSIKNNFENVSNFVESYYRYLYEYDQRITIRQMMSQLSFALTGNLDCNIVQKKRNPYMKFDYNFANLFFGYKGIEEIEEANQIKAIVKLKDLNLDSKSLNEDYDIFVKNNFNCFREDIRNIVKDKWERFSKRYRKDTLSDTNFLIDNNSDEDVNMRKSIRRFLIIYGNLENEGQLSKIISQLFGSIFDIYSYGITKEYSKSQKRELEDLVYKAIYIENVGVPPKGKDKDIYLTLKRNDGNFQNVFLEIGRVEKKYIDIVQKEKNNEFDDIKAKKQSYIRLDRDENYTFLITLPILNYFNAISKGEIITSINPILGHGIARLNSMLFKKFNTKENGDLDDNEFRLIVNMLSKPIDIRMSIENQKINIY